MTMRMFFVSCAATAEVHLAMHHQKKFIYNAGFGKALRPPAPNSNLQSQLSRISLI